MGKETVKDRLLFRSGGTGGDRTGWD